ncbi:hypothetical protein Cagg_1991 [Chloroflexus aggregans DSM 9485]|uniref:O-antigen polymerase n=2 Tax=Chloroflexus aggregans TaxID=152260 RepID=B8GBR2_CHLAD|nr:hypothetical protein Cagg_1991 [Chloroflexus aggregans DSM 9485]
MAMNRNTRMLYWIYIAVAVLSWSPSNALGYLAPFLFLLATSFLIPQWNFLALFIFLTIAWIFQTVFYTMINPNFQIINSFISFATWSGLMILIIFPYKKSIQYTIIRKKLFIFAWMILFIESILGIIQLLYGFIQVGSTDLSVGDFVEGTFHPDLSPELSFSNPMFSIGISLLLILLWKDVTERRNLLKYIIYLVGLSSLVLASTIHIIAIFVVTLIISWFITTVKIKPQKMIIRFGKNVTIVIVIFAVATSLLLSAQPRNTQYLLSARYLSKNTPRTGIMEVIIRELPKEYSFFSLFGLGPGQFASRAGLISTGLYFGGQWKSKPSEITSQAQKKYLLPLKIKQIENPAFGRSSTAAPHSSWIAVFSEWGYLGVIVAILLLLIILNKVNRAVHSFPTEKLILTWGILFFFFLGLGEVYWEVPQAWFPGLVLLKLIYFECKQSTLASKNELSQPAAIEHNTTLSPDG